MQLRRTEVLLVIAQVAAALLSGILLYVSFPPVSEAHTAWLAFLPLLLVARFVTPSRALKLGYISGLCFWLLSISWLISLSKTGTSLFMALLGWLALSSYAAVYTALFTYVASVLLRKEKTISEMGKWKGSVACWRILLVFLIPAVWVGLEYIRSVLFTGFPWNPLGVSQYKNLSVIQVAAWGGVYMVSAVIMVMNTALALTGARIANVFRKVEPSSRFRYELMVGLLVCALCWMHGTRTVMKGRQISSGATEVRIAVVQPNTLQIKKWDLDFEIDIFERLHTQSQLASINRPSLIVWPETAVMRPYNLDDITQEFVKTHTAMGSSILVGAMEKVHVADTDDVYSNWRFYNSSFLVGVDGVTDAVYRKQHLVPFGEYIPMENILPVMRRIIPLGFSCSAGEESTLMTLDVAGTPAVKVPFSVLICFEDIFPALSRKAVLAGAAFLVNQTNDAWFDGTAAHLQHMTHCVFRAVENRVPIARSANSGVSCFITRYGAVNILQGADNPYGLSVEGFKLSGLMARDYQRGATLYNKYGDLILAIPCALLVIGILSFLGYIVVFKRKQRE